MSLRLPLALTAVVLLAAGTAFAQAAPIQTQGEEQLPGQNSVSVHTGILYGIANNTPGGWMLTATYARQLGSTTSPLWIEFGAGFVYGGGNCNFNCGFNGNGDLIQPFGGLRYNLKLPIPLIVYGKADAELLGIFDRWCGDNGVGIAGRGGVGAHYFILKNVGVGLETGVELGLAHYFGPRDTCTGVTYPTYHDEFFVSWDIGVGGEFVF